MSKCKQQFENSSCLCSRFINHHKEIWDQIICMKYFSAIWRYKLEKLHVQFWFHSIFYKNYDHKEIYCSVLKYHRAYYLYITLLKSPKYLIWRKESKTCASACATNGATGGPVRITRCAIQGKGISSVPPQEGTHYCVSPSREFITIWLPIKQNIQKCFCCFHLKLIYPPCRTQRTKEEDNI